MNIRIKTVKFKISNLHTKHSLVYQIIIFYLTEKAIGIVAPAVIKNEDDQENKNDTHEKKSPKHESPKIEKKTAEVSHV